MDQIASSLQKAIQDNYKKLSLLGMASTPEVMCNCTVFKPSGVISSTAPAAPSAPVQTIPSQFIPGEKNDGTLLAIDTGNTPFILPKGVTPDDIMMEQAAAIKPLIAAAEEKAKAAASATGHSTVVATTVPGEATAVAVATPQPGSTTTTVVGGVPTAVTVSASPTTTVAAGMPTGIEKFAPFQYDDISNTYARARLASVPSYRDTIVENSDGWSYYQGARDMYTLSLSSWLIYITLVVVAYYWFFM